MKKFFIIAVMLVAALSAYPQNKRTSTETRTGKVKEKEAVQQSKQAAAQSKQQQQEQNDNQARQKQQQQNDNQARQKQQQQQNDNQAKQQQVKQNRSTQSQNDRVVRDINAAEKQKRINDNNQQAARTKTQAAATRAPRPTDPAPVRIKDTEANRNFREGKGTFTRSNGQVINHQNDQVFAKSRYRIDYDNSVTLRASSDFRVNYREYNNWYDDRSIRTIRYDPGYRPVSFEIRRERYMHREPMHFNLIWTPYLFNRFQYYYPDQTDWGFEYGNEIETIPAYEASDYAGSVRRIYGRVDEVYFSRDDGTYILYIGDRFPYQDLSVVIPRNVAVSITRNPIQYFQNKYVWLIGLIDWWDEKPEVIIRDEQQIQRY